jgi:hypothetical protein
VVLLELVPPEAADGIVANASAELLPISFVRVKAKDVRKRRAVRLKQGVEGVAQDVFHADAPGVGPELLEGFNQAGNCQRYLVVPHATEGVISEGLRAIWRVEIDDPLLLFSRNGSEDAFDRISMRIYEREPATCFQVLKGKGLKERGLPHAGLPDDVDMGETVGLLDNEAAVAVVEVGAGEIGDVAIHSCIVLARAFLLKAAFYDSLSGGRGREDFGDMAGGAA